MTLHNEFDPSPASIKQCFQAQEATSLRLRASTAVQRIDKLKRLRDALLGHRSVFYEAFAYDFRKPESEVELTEFLPVIDEIRHAIRYLPRWMKPCRVAPSLTTLGTSAKVLYQPRGRCLIIGPWNYPVSTTIGPLVSAVAAGNTVILKPSELTPAVNRVVAEVLRQVFYEDEVALIQGGLDTARALLHLPFDHIFFTGSPAVGKIVMAQASQHLSSVTLELGGKSPVVVDDTADLALAARTTMWAKFVNAGQTCVAPDYLLVQRNVRDRFVALCKAALGRHLGATEEAVCASPDFARLISQRHAARVGGLIDEALDKGARAETGGSHDSANRYVAPTLLCDVPQSSAILHEEIFGPVLPILEFDEIDEAISYINGRPKPLALYVWSHDRVAVGRLVSQTSSGGVCINHSLQQFAHSGLPFGGVGQSGLGNAHGYFGFKAFSHERALLRGGPRLSAEIFFPPYTRFTTRLARALVDLLAGRLFRGSRSQISHIDLQR